MMESYRSILAFVGVAVVMILLQLIVGESLSGSVVFLAICVATGVSVGASIRRQRRAGK
jgi:hypothetical protein